MKTGDPFTTVRTEGGLLPSALLQRIVNGDRGLPGLEPTSYHLTASERLTETVSRAWHRLLGAWASFRAAAARLPQRDPATTLTRERWLLVLFQELGYGRLLGARATEFEGKSYPISHFWHHSPIHLVGCQVDLDQRAAGVHGAARTSPHSLVQEFLNRSEQHLWGFVCNGMCLRILRDNVSLTRQTFVEFDLEGMFEGEIYADFVLLWLLCHQSRIEAVKPEDCWLESWARTAQEEGTRALDRLRRGVEHAITVLGSGLLAHPANSELRKKLRQGDLSTQDYYRQLLRLVYRLLFLFVAEDRGLLLDPEADPSAHERYGRFYSTARLRHLSARRRGTRHADLYRGVRIVMERLGSDDGCPPLALPPLGSFLWSAAALPELGHCDLANRDLLEAVRALAFTREDSMLRPIDYKNLGSEELGSVYESLLELHPDLNVDAPTFALQTASGHERKTTGSYYTPTSLVQCLLDSALDPVLQTAARQPAAEAAILALKICDPACGSGHFLIAAAHRIAKRLATVRTGDDEPSPEATRAALRDVISHCIYGVDANPMAVELCKVSLWLEALQPGKPLTFLEHRIQCGNSLLGTTPALLSQGIPDEAFQPIEGDDKQVVSALRKRHKAERAGQMTLDFAAASATAASALAEAFAGLNAMDDTSITDVHRKEHHYTRLARSPEYRTARLLADAWCAAFVWKKTQAAPEAVTYATFHHLLTEPERVPDTTRAEIARLAEQYNFLHWHLAFPDVFRVPTDGEAPENQQIGWNGGFDVVLGNPPWEHTELKEKEWFATRRPDIAQASTGAARKRMIIALRGDDPALYAAFTDELRKADGISHLVRSTERYPLCGRGRINTYAIFAETNRMLLAPTGRVGCIVPSGIATDDTTKYFFQELMQTQSLASLYDFENRLGLFPAVDSRMKFCLLTLTGAGQPATHGAEFVFFAHGVDDLRDAQRRFTLAARDLALLNPNTRTCPVFRSQRDAELTKEIYRRVPVFIKEGPPEENPWGISFKQGLFNMTSDSSLFRTREQLEADGWALDGNVFRQGGKEYLPLYEAKMFHHFDHRWATHDGLDTRDLTPTEKDTPTALALPRYWVPAAEVTARLADKWDHDWLIGIRGITNTTNERTILSSVIPRVGVGHSAPLILMQHDVSHLGGVLANLSSFALDFIARFKVGGVNLSFFMINQLPVLPPSTYAQPCPWACSPTSLLPTPYSLCSWLLPRVLELTYTTWDLAPFAKDCGYDGPPFRWDDERRFVLRCELDAASFHLYGIARDDVDYIMDTFPIVKRKDEAQCGEYRTKRVILEVYDAMQHAIDTGNPYQTHLDPSPGPLADGLPSWRPGSSRPGNWPPHIHAPRSEQRG
jgi:hypothetical protein